MKEGTTLPIARFPKGIKPNPLDLAAGRYGTEDMAKIWGPGNTFDLSLRVQGVSALVMSRLHPEVISREHAEEIYQTSINDKIDHDKIRELEEITGHDVIAINKSLEDELSQGAKAHVNKGKTSADTTQPVRALQIKYSLQVIILVTENLRDILCEKAIEWRDIPFMDVTHLYDALPSTAGRPLVHYIEMLQSNLEVLKFVYNNSIKGKWGDSTGNHHSNTALGINGIKLQEEFCSELQVGFMNASAQVPGLEFEFDVFFAMSRLMETINNIAKFIAWGRSDDVNIFINANPKRKKGSSGMPHKDAKNGNPTTEEQAMSFRNFMLGNLMTAGMNCEMPYARNLSASANGRIIFEDGFKTLDHILRNLSNTIYWIALREDRCIERVDRSFGVVTAQQVMTYLTDHRKTTNPMSRSEAHNLTGKLAGDAWETRTSFTDIVLANEEITSRLSEQTIREITDPKKYIGQTKEIIDIVVKDFYKKKTLED